MRRCLVKSNPRIFLAIHGAIVKYNLTYSIICTDAEARGMQMDRPALSRYLKSFNDKGEFLGYQKGSLSQEQILWLCIRYDIGIQIVTKFRKMDTKRVEMRLKKIFGLDGGKTIQR